MYYVNDSLTSITTILSQKPRQSGDVHWRQKLSIKLWSNFTGRTCVPCVEVVRRSKAKWSISSERYAVDGQCSLMSTTRNVSCLVLSHTEDVVSCTTDCVSCTLVTAQNYFRLL